MHVCFVLSKISLCSPHRLIRDIFHLHWTFVEKKKNNKIGKCCPWLPCADFAHVLSSVFPERSLIVDILFPRFSISIHWVWGVWNRSLLCQDSAAEQCYNGRGYFLETTKLQSEMSIKMAYEPCFANIRLNLCALSVIPKLLVQSVNQGWYFPLVWYFAFKG